MNVCERQEAGLWLVLEDKKPVVAFPSKEQAEQYCPIYVAKREDVPIMEIVHVSFHDYYQSLLRRPVRVPSVPPGVTATPFIPPKLGPPIPKSGPSEPLDISKFRDAIEKLRKSPTWEEMVKPEHYGPVGKPFDMSEWVGDPAFDRFAYGPGGGGYATSGTA